MNIEKDWLETPDTGVTATAPDQRVSGREARLAFDKKVGEIFNSVKNIEEVGPEWRFFRAESFYTDTPEAPLDAQQQILAGVEIRDAMREHGVNNVAFVREEDGRLSVYYRREPASS